MVSLHRVCQSFVTLADPGQRRKIAERYAAGETMAELAADCEVGEATIWRGFSRPARL
ncbi:ECF-type sigma factor (plasmid) [Bradyrhizobium sp. CB82]|uniref:ECF-type sigma factor n=1 Tax=Bradyrhizobium sp. CB82 TaxID=3039159 RepID=UPI0024B233F3|nr:ECF-type sigma factor [Bradyrhizobium sp. CB82]WFU45808.1 ECF-type sigma factor [Bradyrhizobium sp. CB82]